MKPSDDYESELTPEQEDIIVKVETRLAAGLTEPRLSLETGVDLEDITRILNRRRVENRWDNRADEETTAAIATLAEWLGSETEQTQSGFADTPLFNQLQAIFTHAHQNRQLVAITGSWGIGKSEAAKAYAASHPRGYQKPGALRIQFSESDKKPASAYSKILGALRGDCGHAYRNGNLHDAIGAALSPGDCLLLDECNHLKDAMEVVRSIYDDFGIAIVMIGNPEFTDTVWGKQSRFAALASRTARFDFPASTAEDVESWIAWKGLLEGKKPGERAEIIAASINLFSSVAPCKITVNPALAMSYG